MILEVYTDGACRGNPGRGACGYYISENVNEVVTYKKTTNNRMEFNAILMALKYIKENYKTVTKIVLYTDSQLAHGIFYNGWKANKNLDLVHKITDLINSMTGIIIEFEKVKGHSNNEGNNTIDKLLNKNLDHSDIMNDLEDEGYEK